MSINDTRAELHYLEDEARHLGERLDRCDRGSPASHAIARKLDIVWRMINEKRDQIERSESEAPRRAAEARLAYHVENDTLDLY